MSWVQSSNGHAPAGAISSGKTREGEELLIGRAQYQGSTTPGKIHKSHGCLYFPYGGVEVSSKTYEVLIGPKRVEWVQGNTKTALPAGAIHAGNDTDGTPMYVGRAYHENDQLIAKVMPAKQAAYVSYNGKEILKLHYEILCNGNVKWVPGSAGKIPTGAVVGGKTGTGEILYVGRGRHENCLTVGKIHPSHNSIYIPFGGAEVALKNFEFLVEF